MEEKKMMYIKPAVGSMEDFHGFIGAIFAVVSAVAALAVGAILRAASRQMNQLAAQRRRQTARQRAMIGYSF